MGCQSLSQPNFILRRQKVANLSTVVFKQLCVLLKRIVKHGAIPLQFIIRLVIILSTISGWEMISVAATLSQRESWDVVNDPKKTKTKILWKIWGEFFPNFFMHPHPYGMGDNLGKVTWDGSASIPYEYKHDFLNVFGCVRLFQQGQLRWIDQGLWPPSWDPQGFTVAWLINDEIVHFHHKGRHTSELDQLTSWGIGEYSNNLQ